MSRNRIIYNVQDVLVGPSDQSLAQIFRGKNILKRLYRVQSVSYGIDTERENIRELGSDEVINPIVKAPKVSFNLSYLNANLANEYNLGFNLQYQNNTDPILYSPSGVPLLSGIGDDSRAFDARNIYLAVNSSSTDILEYAAGKDYITDSGNAELADFIDPKSSGYHVVCFYNSYITSYSTEVSVGSFLRSNVTFDADTIVYFASGAISTGSGMYLPRLDNQTASLLNADAMFCIPKHYRDDQPSVLVPKDITLRINGINDIGLDFLDTKIQGFNLSITIPRESENYLGYALPAQKQVYDWPVELSLNIAMVVGDLASGNAIDLLSEDNDYNVTINVDNFNANAQTSQNPAIIYLIRKAKFKSINYSDSIGGNKAAELSFSSYLSPRDLNCGLFLSGIGADIDVFDHYLLREGDGDILATEAGEALLSEPVRVRQYIF